jgi:uncharacterized protein (TIGR03435 family)
MSKTCIFLVLAAVVAFAADPQFEVATIRPATGAPGGWVPGFRSGRFYTTESSLKTLIGYAYSIPAIQISGPGWIDSQFFDITATLPAGSTPDRAPAMLQALLADRFHVRVHRETADMNHYVLTIGKSGSKLLEIKPGDPVPSPAPFGPGPPSIYMTNGTVADFAQGLARMLGRPVVEKTGLAGRFHIMIRYAKPNATEPGPDLLTAVQEQLGLKLEAQKGPVEILKVDSADKAPTGN